MAAQALRRLITGGMLLAALAPALADDTTFLDGPQLAAKLMRDVVRIDAADLDEHGFGLVVAIEDDDAWIVTARHVVARRPLAGLEGTERISARVEVAYCGAPDAGTKRASSVRTVGEPADDIALLRVPRPRGFVPDPRAIAAEAHAAAGAETWILGFESRCEAVAGSGAIESARDARHNLRVRQPGVLGGSSGAPLVVGHGIAGIVKTSDQVHVTAHAIDDLQRRLIALGVPWALGDARNIPPTDPRAAEIDLAETLNRYLFGLRDVHALLQQPVVARQTFAEKAAAYNAAVERFRNARDKYDGTLQRDWPPGVLAQWTALREQLWAVHLNFFRLNDRAREIAETERTPVDVRDRMKALEPEVAALESAIAQFLRNLGQRRNQDASRTS